mmetsp:Transcript_18676/g.62927  ORF Transcript_18676/g.62927 Transcript_18676/m.62927 type:complete len:416 (+) Transcript_18676:954-2201(+)
MVFEEGRAVLRARAVLCVTPALARSLAAADGEEAREQRRLVRPLAHGLVEHDHVKALAAQLPAVLRDRAARRARLEVRAATLGGGQLPVVAAQVGGGDAAKRSQLAGGRRQRREARLAQPRVDPRDVLGRDHTVLVQVEDASRAPAALAGQPPQPAHRLRPEGRVVDCEGGAVLARHLAGRRDRVPRPPPRVKHRRRPCGGGVDHRQVVIEEPARKEGYSLHDEGLADAGRPKDLEPALNRILVLVLRKAALRLGRTLSLPGFKKRLKGDAEGETLQRVGAEEGGQTRQRRALALADELARFLAPSKRFKSLPHPRHRLPVEHRSAVREALDAVVVPRGSPLGKPAVLRIDGAEVAVVGCRLEPSLTERSRLRVHLLRKPLPPLAPVVAVRVRLVPSGPCTGPPAARPSPGEAPS